MNRCAPRFLALAPVALLLAGCATVPGQDRLAEKDPLEKFNRAVWGVNMTADKILVRPVTQVYRAVAPKPARQGVHNFFSNVTEPWSFVNNLLQGKPKRAGQNLKRFLINTTIGVGGLFDHATKMGVQPAPEDLGQTLAVWGVNGGPYLVLPLLGPTTLRDGIGSAVAAYADPVNVGINQADVSVWYKRGYRAAQVVDARSELIESGGDSFLKSSLDPYAAARSAYLQRHKAAVLDQEDMADAGPPDDADVGIAATPPGEATPTPAGNPADVPAAKPTDSVPVTAPADAAQTTPEQDTTTPPPAPVTTPKL
jgi:phospholipid-binding lipoprotein MlaA